jgi:hypothetical protein
VADAVLAANVTKGDRIGRAISGRMLVVATGQANRAGLAAYRGTFLMCGTADEPA